MGRNNNPNVIDIFNKNLDKINKQADDLNKDKFNMTEGDYNNKLSRLRFKYRIINTERVIYLISSKMSINDWRNIRTPKFWSVYDKMSDDFNKRLYLLSCLKKYNQY